MDTDRFKFTLEEPFDVAYSRCRSVIKALGWRISKDLTQEYQIACYVPIPELLPQAPVYFIAFYPDDRATHVALIASSDDLSQSYAKQDLPVLKTALLGGDVFSLAPDAGERESLPAEQQTQARCFISYRRYDSADVVGRIYDRLAAAFGAEKVFKDVDNIPIGADFRRELDEAVSRCAVVLVVIGRDWLAVTDEHGQRRLDDPADFVRIEIETALRRNIPIVPVLVREAAMPRAEEMPESLSELVYRHGAQIRPDPDFHHDMDRLIQSLGQLLQQ